MLELAIVIPSRGRSRCQETVRLFPEVILCVGDDERAAYEKENPGVHVLAHPSDLLGMGRKRQWVLDHVDAETVFMVDDDVTGLYCLVGHQYRPIRDPFSIYNVVEQAARVAGEIGTGLFGFAHTADVRHFRAQSPFGFSGYINGFSFGVIGRRFRFDQFLDTKQDIDFSLQVLLHDRILWRDERFAFKNSKWFKRVGGMAGIRTAETVARDVARLRLKWGGAVEVNHSERNNRKHQQNVRLHVQR